jgi:POT family proton-dependent oligopeptide transporter
MQALLTLYMIEVLFLPAHAGHVIGFESVRGAVEWLFGPQTTLGFATQVFGLYVGLVYFTPLFGGILGDVWLGRVRSVVLGGLLMAAGHICLAFDASFFFALLLLIAGAGLLRGNLSPQLGALYDAGDRRRDVGFQILGSSVNIGAFIAPLVTGALQQEYNWHIAFGFAAVGMLVGVAVYLWGRRSLPPERRREHHVAIETLNRSDRGRILFLIALVPVATTFWIAQSQVWNTYNVWVRDHVDLMFGQWHMPVVWLQSLDGIAPFFFMPSVVWLWGWQAKHGREPAEFTKVAIGCFIFGAATMLLAAASWTAGSGRASLLWSIAFHLGSNIGWLFFSPVMAAAFTRIAPKAVNATMLGVYYLSIFAGSVISGRLGGLYEVLSPGMFWTLHAAIVGVGGVLFLIARALAPRTTRTGA